MSRFKMEILFNTKSDITADRSKRLSLSDKRDGVDGGYSYDGLEYVSLLQGNDNATKMKNIQPLNKGEIGDNASDQTYSQLLNSMNNDERYKNNDALKQRHLNVYSKVYGYRKRIDEILSMMRSQTKNDASLLYTIRVDETIIKEMRMMLSYLAIIERTNDIIIFEKGMNIYDKFTATTNTLTEMPVKDTVLVDKIKGGNSIFKIPLEDDTYNTNDEKRYLYGITYYYNGGKE